MRTVRIDALTIGQLAKAAGVPTSTLRFYEREGLVLPAARTGANYRAYPAETAERVRFIRSALASGFAIKDIAQLLDLTHPGQRPCDEVYALYDRRLAEVRERLKELKRVEKALIKSKAACCEAGEADLMAKLKPAAKRPLTLHQGASCTTGACQTTQGPPAPQNRR